MFAARTGRRVDVSAVSRQVKEAVLAQVAEATVKRTQDRLRRGGSSRLASSLRARGPLIESQYGGPGPIRPVNKQALYWPGARHPVKFVNGKGIEPLIRAEAKRISGADLPPGSVNI